MGIIILLHELSSKCARYVVLLYGERSVILYLVYYYPPWCVIFTIFVCSKW